MGHRGYHIHRVLCDVSFGVTLFFTMLSTVCINYRRLAEMAAAFPVAFRCRFRYLSVYMYVENEFNSIFGRLLFLLLFLLQRLPVWCEI